MTQVSEQQTNNSTPDTVPATATNVPIEQTREQNNPPADPPKDAPPSKEADPPKAPEPEKKPDETKAEAIKLEDLKLPEGFKADEAQFKTVLDVFNNPEMSNKDKLSSLVAMHADGIKQLEDHINASNKKQWDDLQTKWATDIANSQDLGSGDPKNPLKPEVNATIAKVINQLGGHELREILALTGAGNHPAVARALLKMGPYMTENEKHVDGKPPSTTPKGPGGHALYPDLPTG